MSNKEIMKVERQIFELSNKLSALRQAAAPMPVPDYHFETLSGESALSGLFGNRKLLLAIHNMGQGCRYCTLWADGFNGLLQHLEATLAVVLLSPDPPHLQRDFANSRGWRFRLASHGGGNYIAEQTVMEGHSNMPGAVVYERSEDAILRRNSVAFGPGDLFCPVWHLLPLAGIDTADWTPQFRYWRPPAALDDGGENVLD